jgi:hypothetical protein
MEESMVIEPGVPEVQVRRPLIESVNWEARPAERRLSVQLQTPPEDVGQTKKPPMQQSQADEDLAQSKKPKINESQGIGEFGSKKPNAVEREILPERASKKPYMEGSQVCEEIAPKRPTMNPSDLKAEKSLTHSRAHLESQAEVWQSPVQEQV